MRGFGDHERHETMLESDNRKIRPFFNDLLAVICKKISLKPWTAQLKYHQLQKQNFLKLNLKLNKLLEPKIMSDDSHRFARQIRIVPT